MFQRRSQPQTLLGTALRMGELIFHDSVRTIRKSHRHALIGLLMNMLQTFIFVAVFYVMFSILGLRQMAVRGDFLLYLLSGIFLFMTHNKTLKSVMAAEGPTSPMMQHAPMNTIIAIGSAALSTLYIQVLSMTILLLVYNAINGPIYIYKPAGAMGMLLLSWFTGVAVGIILLAIKPWAPKAISLIAMMYQRANMIASGKMFLANTMPGYLLAMFDWNPLFHEIDQARGFIFLNYNPHFSSISYPFFVSLALFVLGLMGESFTRRHASVSWSAGK